MMTITLALALFAATSSTGTAPVAAPTSDAPAFTEVKPKKPKKICKAVTVTERRLGKRQCKTIEQWEMDESAMELGQKGAKGNLAPPQIPTGI